MSTSPDPVPEPPARRGAVIDIGSSSIKLLVAGRGAGGEVVPLHQASRESRISRGIGGAEPRLGEEGMAAGVEAVGGLAAEAQPFSPVRTVVTATSAVRDAANGADFIARIEAATGLDVRLLSGEEEARYIGRGVAQDPALAAESAFYLGDLGGGSLELLEYRGGEVRQATSLRLGAVRMTERFVPDPRAPLQPSAAAAVEAHVRAEIAASGFVFGADGPLVGTGGSLNHARRLLGYLDSLGGAEKKETPPPAAAPEIPAAALRRALDQLGALTLEERLRIPVLPANRADILPAALVTLLALLDGAGRGAFLHSTYNLRFGLAAELLEG